MGGLWILTQQPWRVPSTPESSIMVTTQWPIENYRPTSSKGWKEAALVPCLNLDICVLWAWFSSGSMMTKGFWLCRKRLTKLVKAARNSAFELGELAQIKQVFLSCRPTEGWWFGVGWHTYAVWYFRYARWSQVLIALRCWYIHWLFFCKM